MPYSCISETLQYCKCLQKFFLWYYKAPRTIIGVWCYINAFYLLSVLVRVYRCRICDITVPSLENLLSHECQAFSGKFLVYLSAAVARNKSSK